MTPKEDALISEKEQLEAEQEALGAPAYTLRDEYRKNESGATETRGVMKRVTFADIADWRVRKEAWAAANPEKGARYAEISARLDELERVERRAAERRAMGYLARQRMEKAGVGVRIIRTLTGELKPTAALSEVQKWWPSDSWCLALLGGKGTGKSTAAGWAALEALTSEHSMVWVRCTAESRESLFGPAAAEFVRDARRCKLLVLEEVGSEFFSDVWRSWLEDVIDSRYADMRKTLITSNAEVPAFKERLGARIVDRIAHDGVVVGTGTQSLRTEP